MNIRTTTAALALLAASLSAMAEIKVNDNFSVNGYATASYWHRSESPGTSFNDTNLDKALLGGTFTFQPVTANVSVLYRNLPTGAPNSVALLDAYLTYKAADGLSFTAGNFLSYMGYEAFHPISMDQITYANGDFLAPIPGYHTGVRIDYSGATSSTGFAVVDSVYSPNGPIRGDGEIKHNAGFEYFYSYTGIKDVTLWAGAVYDTAGGYRRNQAVTMFDFWASYKASDKIRVAAEFAHKNGGDSNTGYNWLAFLDYSINEKVSCAFRISGESVDSYTIAGTPAVLVPSMGFTKYTICPAYAITKNISVRAEYSHYNYTNYTLDSANEFRVQTVFKF